MAVKSDFSKGQEFQKKQPKFLRRVRNGAIIGGVLALLGLGYKDNFQTAFRSAEKEATAVATARAEVQDTRTTWQKITKKGTAPKVEGVSKVDILKRTPKHINPKPNIPLGNPMSTAKTAGAGALVGAGLGIASFGMKKRKLNKQFRRPGK